MLQLPDLGLDWCHSHSGEAPLKVNAKHVSLKLDGKTLCHPSDGYDIDLLDVDLDDYDEIASVSGPLPPNDAVWPKGAPLIDVILYGDRILKRKISQ